MKKSIRRSGILVTLLLSMLFMSSVAFGETVPNYDVDAAVDYAENHWDDGTEWDGTKEDCIEFARTCVQKGGVPKDAARVRKNGTGYSVKEYVDYMVDCGYAELNELTITPVTLGNGKTYPYISVAANKNLVSPGDIIIYRCTGCSKGYFHASLCAPADKSGMYAGYYRYYAHNSAVGNEPLIRINCFGCKKASNVSMYALHITSKANGYSAYTKAATGVKVKCVDYNTLKVSWNAVSGAEKYNVFYKKSKSGFWRKLETVKGTSVTDTISSADQAKVKYYAVRPVNVTADMNYVGKISSTVTGYTVPDSVKNLKVRLTDSRNMKVTWSKAKGATAYHVYIKASGDSKWSYVCSTKGTSATTKNLKWKLAAGKKHTFKVVPYRTYKVGSKTYERERPTSSTKSCYTLKKVSKPTVKRVSSKTVKVSWTNISGESGYQISKSTKKSGTKIIKTYKTTKGANYEVSAKKGEKYYYKVRAYKTEVVNGKSQKVYGPWSSVKYY